MKQIMLNPDEAKALGAFKSLVSLFNLESPTTTEALIGMMAARGHRLPIRSIRKLGEYCRRESPPFCVCYASGVGIWLARDLDEARAYIIDSGNRAFHTLEQRRNVFNHLRKAAGYPALSGSIPAEIPEIDVGGFQEELDLDYETTEEIRLHLDAEDRK